METFYIIIFAQELCKVFMTYMGIMGKSYRLRLWQTIVLSAATLAAVVGGICILGEDYTATTRYFVVVLYVMAAVCFYETVWMKFLMFLPAYCGICILDMGIFSLLNLVLRPFSIFSGRISQVLISNCVSLLVICLISFVASRISKNKERFTWKNYIFATFSIVISAFFVAYANFVLLQFDTDVNRFMNMVFCVVWVMLLLIIFIYMNVSWKKERYKMQLESSERMMAQQQQYYEMMLNKDEDMRRFRHDYKNHLSIINDYISNGKIQEANNYLQQVIKKAEQLNTYKTGNSLIDIILNDIVEKHKEMGIKVTVKGKFMERNDISAYDICTIFYNSIENAFEAAAKAAPEERFVRVNIFNNNRWLVEIKNATLQDVVIVNNHVETTKKDKRFHGMGLKNIEQCIANHGGMFQLECKNQVFTTRIIL